ncbi:MAG: sigma-54-dependent Fis family transcriptional regulator [Deltaproteobacteria bacterium]|nr:sigma-54-dependent Fis family transcriptional regulator [Deltaproteobacteria bacterium]
MGTVLVVEDDRGVREGLLRALASAGHRGVGAEGLAAAREALRGSALDCVLLDVRLGDGDGLAFLSELKAGLAPQVPVVLATAYGDSDRTIAAMRAGAFDYVTKPFDLPALLATVERAVRQRSLVARTPASAPEGESATGPRLVGQSAPMLAVWKVLGRAAASDAPVLITGETGTGKELAARAIHAHSARSRGPFVAVNLAAVPPTLLESELFGHEKGAFTGASARRAGRLEAASGGTLFLDEVGDLDLGLQTRLLRVLQDGRYERVGSTEPLRLEARVLAATHRPVRPGVPGATLREDLYYRLAVLDLELPPLRARRSDIPLLVAEALRNTRARAVSEAAMARLLAHDWPGNVRELMHTIQRAAVLSAAEVLDASDLPADLGLTPGVGSLGDDPYDGLPLREALHKLEHRMLERALERAGGNRSEAARLLGIARPQLYTKLEEHGILPREKG